MSRRKLLFLAVIMSVGLSLGFANQNALASETDTEVTDVSVEISGAEAADEADETSEAETEVADEIDGTSEAEAEVTAVTDETESGTDEVESETGSVEGYAEVEADMEDLTGTSEEVIRVLNTDEDTVLYSGTDGILYQTGDGALYYVSASTGKTVTSQLVEISSGSYKGTYYFGSDGYAVKNAFQTVSGSTYYFGTDGVKYTGTGKKQLTILFIISRVV